ncbi:MAG TPA: NAD(P)-dependent oxidoreductase [Gemmatimonadaceae bacterium]|nr:NAD(P)-dependent oxidoreductase [Gemmatimonadaceae bacterium]
MSGYPVLLEGTAITALVVGGGSVASRKVRGLLAAGARVLVVAPSVTEELLALGEREKNLTIEHRRFQDEDVRDVTLVFAATDERTTNSRIARIARGHHRLVSVADLPSEGSFSGMAAHCAGDVVIGVSAGGVPRAAARIRDAIAERFDGRYATAIDAVRAMRRRLLDTGGAAKWEQAMRTFLDERFCTRVESGELTAEVDAWH